MPSVTYRRYVLFSLTLVYTLNSLDIPLMTLLLQPIKQDLHLSDAQLGFLTGMAFAVFYATLGLPLARWVDRGHRVTIAALAIGLWGATVMSCLFVKNFAQLVLTRVAAGVGESGCLPSTYSLLGDYFPEPAERTRAMAIYMLSGPLAPLISFIGGGWVNDHYGWRVAFFAMGAPGLALALLLKLTVREPRRFGSAPRADTDEGGISAIVRTLWKRKSLRHLTAALVLFYTIGLGLSPWLAAFMIRSHGMTTSSVGMWFGLIWGVGGMVGVLLGGYASERWCSSDEPRQLRLMALVTACLLPCYLLVLFLRSSVGSVAAMTPLVIAGNFIFGPVFALLQRLVPDRLRATALAIVMLLANLIGMGVGPQIAGSLSDLLAPWAGADSLRYAMLVPASLALWSAAHFWRAAATVKADLFVVSHEEGASPGEGAITLDGAGATPTGGATSP